MGDRKIITGWKKEMIELLFPLRCPVCDEIVMPRGKEICHACEKELKRISGPCCMKCGRELFSESEELCTGCKKRRYSFEYGVVLYHYSDAAAASMARIKYKGKQEYLKYYARQAVHYAGAQIRNMHPDALIPVPVHAERRRERGYNQAELLAEHMGNMMQIPVLPEALRRRKNTTALKALGAGQRFQQMSHAFYQGEIPPGLKRVCLIDDIFTTGATMEACTRVLKQAGIEQVYCFSLCASLLE